MRRSVAYLRWTAFALLMAAGGLGLATAAAGGSSPPGVAERSARIGAIENELDRVDRALSPLERKVEKQRRFFTCITEVGVSEFGDADRRFGFHYEELDGGGLEYRPALTIDRRKRGAPDYRLLEFAATDRCQSDSTQVGTPGNPGTADPARALAVHRHQLRVSPLLDELNRLQRRLERLEDRAEVVDRASERFDDWESCLTAVPVTEYGDPGGRFGFRFSWADGSQGYEAAIAEDTSPLDDPDYLLLAFARRDDPRAGGECGEDPGEGVDRAAAPVPPSKEIAEDLLGDASSLLESVDDLGEPIGEFTTFDECVYPLGLRESGKLSGASGYLYGDAARPRPALAIDSGERGEGELQFLVTPGEEPPSIECNEDASGESTDE